MTVEREIRSIPKVRRMFTDGACSGNPGPGGWAVVMLFDEQYEVISGHETMTTNNRMEMIAAREAIREALQYDENTRVEIHSDSAYVVNAITKGWLLKWKFNGWKTVQNDDVKNADIWVEIYDLLNSTKAKIAFIKVKGHAGNTFNELADEAAVQQCLIARDKAVQE